MTDDQTNARIMELRETMKGYTALDGELLSDQAAGVSRPPDGNTMAAETEISLPRAFADRVPARSLVELLETRASRRRFSDVPLPLEDLSFLMWATQGVRKTAARPGGTMLRTVPSAGARHPLETYLLVHRVAGLEPGLYQYLPSGHRLARIRTVENAADRIAEATLGQVFMGSAAVDFIWTAVPYRSEWRYVTKAQKYALLDAVHARQNLHFACEAIGCASCLRGAYDQERMDALLGLPSGPSCADDDEFVVYMAAVGWPV